MSLLTGAGSVFALGGNYYSHDSALSDEEHDEAAIESDLHFASRDMVRLHAPHPYFRQTAGSRSLTEYVTVISNVSTKLERRMIYLPQVVTHKFTT